MKRWAGFHIPSIELNAWICPTYHPSHVMRENKEHLREITSEHLRAAYQREGSRPFHKIPDFLSEVRVILDPGEAAEIIRSHKDDTEAAFDLETNMIKPEGEGSEIVSCAISWQSETIAFPWIGEAIKATREFIRCPTWKIAANMKYEDRWIRHHLKTRVRNWHWDTMIAAHHIDNRPWITGLKFQAFVNFGATNYAQHVEQYFQSDSPMTPNRVREVKTEDLLLYNGCDALFTLMLAGRQMLQIKDREPYRVVAQRFSCTE